MLTEISATESDLDGSDTGLVTALFCIIYLMFRFSGVWGEDTHWVIAKERHKEWASLFVKEKKSWKAASQQVSLPAILCILIY